MRWLLIALLVPLSGCAELGPTYPGPFPASGACAGLVEGNAAGYIVVDVPDSPNSQSVRVELIYLPSEIVAYSNGPGCHAFLTTRDGNFRVEATMPGNTGQTWSSGILAMSGPPIFVPATTDSWS